MSQNINHLSLEEYNFCLEFTGQSKVNAVQFMLVDSTSKKDLGKKVDYIIWYHSREEGRYQYITLEDELKFDKCLKEYFHLSDLELLQMMFVGEIRKTFPPDYKYSEKELFCILYQAKKDAQLDLSENTLYDIILRRYPKFTDVINKYFIIQACCQKIKTLQKSIIMHN